MAQTDSEKICTYRLHDTFQFIKQIKQLDTANEWMLSLDEAPVVTNLLLVQAMCDHIETIGHNESIPIHLFKVLLKQRISHKPCVIAVLVLAEHTHKSITLPLVLVWLVKYIDRLN